MTDDGSPRHGVWVLPTYGRPGRCQDMLDSVAAAGTATPGVVLVDGDPDPAYDALRLPAGWSIERCADNLDIGGRLNAFFDAHPSLPWYGVVTDDQLVRTQDWDALMLARLEPFAIVHSDDGWRAPARLAGALLFDGSLLRALGLWLPRGLRHCYGDNFWEGLTGTRGPVRRIYAEDVLIEELHDGNGKAPTDASYLRGRASVFADARIYERFKREGGLAAAAAAVQRARQLQLMNESWH